MIGAAARVEIGVALLHDPGQQILSDLAKCLLDQACFPVLNQTRCQCIKPNQLAKTGAGGYAKIQVLQDVDVYLGLDFEDIILQWGQEKK